MRKTVTFIIVLISLMISACTKDSCIKTYQTKNLPTAKINIDGNLNELEWNYAKVTKDFTFPWEKSIAPLTEFRALHDNKYLYFSFKAHDEDIVFYNEDSDEKTVINEDRCELYFSSDYSLKKYYCIEIDSRGRFLDYSSSYHRKFDFSWNFPGVKTAASLFKQGYIVEGHIPWSTFQKLNILPFIGDNKIRIGIFRAQISSGQKSEDEYRWISWIDPKTKEPDFHIPQTFGCLELTE